MPFDFLFEMCPPIAGNPNPHTLFSPWQVNRDRVGIFFLPALLGGMKDQDFWVRQARREGKIEGGGGGDSSKRECDSFPHTFSPHIALLKEIKKKKRGAPLCYFRTKSEHVSKISSLFHPPTLLLSLPLPPSHLSLMRAIEKGE